MTMDWKAYQNVCLVAAGQCGREYWCEKDMRRSGWDAYALEPSPNPTIALPARKTLGYNIALEEALLACRTYEIEKDLDAKAED